MVRTPIIAITLLMLIHPVVNAQADSSYAFIVAGHAYGSHDGENIGLHPALLNSLNAGYDSTVAFFVFTGDIVNRSTEESWQQVEDELDSYSLPSYYVMGNHDENDVGQQVFSDKHGGTYYSFNMQRDLFIVLNSTEAGRSISSDQIEFLKEKLRKTGDTIRNIFIFFHEVLWNSHEKYKEVRSNNRSRYDQMADYSNYWEEVHPILMEVPEKEIFLITGDVGGRPDAIAAFYDSWDHITFISSGMGEVTDENYLLVRVSNSDLVELQLVPLNQDEDLPDLEFFSIPPAPGAITGPVAVTSGGGVDAYSVSEVFNADSYVWEIPEGATGSSVTNIIEIAFDIVFEAGSLSVQAARDGFGAGPSASLEIKADATSIVTSEAEKNPLQISFTETNDCHIIRMRGFDGDMITIRIFNIQGKILKSEKILGIGGYAEMNIPKHELSEGVFLIFATAQNQSITSRLVIR